MERNPLFSVIIANYNNGCYLQDAIDSLLAQNYDNWEAIIIDDASPDNSKEVYDRYKDDSRFHIVFNEENKGYAYSVNRGVRLAQGVICARLDPDDVLFGTDVLETHVQKHLEMPEVVLVYSGMYRADENLNIVNEVYRQAVPEGSSFLEMRGWPVQHFASFKREAFLRVGGCDETQRRAVDYGLYYRLEEVGKTYYLNKLQYVQRNNPHSMSLNDNSYKASSWHVYACVEAMKRRGLKDESLMLFPIESTLRKEYKKGYKTGYENGYEKATSSRVYKAGLVLASPLLWLKKLLKR
jgi:glycosyltransferase involved in cell wall biosynthesis